MIKTLVLLFLAKLVDSALKTTRNIALFKGHKLLAATLDGVSMLITLLIFGTIFSINDIYSKVAVALGVFAGNLSGQSIFNKHEKEKVWMFNIVGENRNEVKQIADKIRKMNFNANTYDTYNSKKEKTLGIKVISTTKEESSILREVIPSHFKFHIIELKQFGLESNTY